MSINASPHITDSSRKPIGMYALFYDEVLGITI